MFVYLQVTCIFMVIIDMSWLRVLAWFWGNYFLLQSAKCSNALPLFQFLCHSLILFSIRIHVTIWLGHFRYTFVFSTLLIYLIGFQDLDLSLKFTIYYKSYQVGLIFSLCPSISTRNCLYPFFNKVCLLFCRCRKN